MLSPAYCRLDTLRIRRILDDQQLKKWWVAESAGVHKTTLRRWLSGKICRVHVHHVSELARVLQVADHEIAFLDFAQPAHDAHRWGRAGTEGRCKNFLTAQNTKHGRGIVKQLSFALVCLWVGVSGTANAQISPGQWSQFSKELVAGHQKLEGKWGESQTWEGWFCDGFYNYQINLQAVLKNLDLELTEEGTMIATADLAGLHAKVLGSYRSKATLCIPAGGWLGAGADWAQLKTEVRFGDSGEMKDVSLKILSTRFGKFEFGRIFPDWFENFFTGVLNRALTAVWNSKMGNWISEKVTQEARKHIPKNR